MVPQRLYVRQAGGMSGCSIIIAIFANENLLQRKLCKLKICHFDRSSLRSHRELRSGEIRFSTSISPARFTVASFETGAKSAEPTSCLRNFPFHAAAI